MLFLPYLCEVITQSPKTTQTMEITFHDCTINEVPVFIAEFAQILNRYRECTADKQEVLNYFGTYLMADNTECRLNFKADKGCDCDYIHANQHWIIVAWCHLSLIVALK